MNAVATGAVVESDRVGERVSIGECAVIRRGAEIGDGVVVHPHAIIGPGVSLGAEVEVFPGALIGKEPSLIGSVARRRDVPKVVTIGSGSSIGLHAVLYYDTAVGPDTLVGDGVSLREGCRVGGRCILGRYVTLNYNVVVGDGTRIMDQSHLTGNTRIGSDVFVSALVGSANDSAFGQEDHVDERMQGPTIEDGAMVGVGASLLPGVVIGRSAVVAAGAVVTRDVEPETRVMGTPARRVDREPAD